MKKPKIVHIYGGSGFAMYTHLGVSQCLYDHGVKPDAVVGVSGGSIVALLIATGMAPKFALDITKKILPSTFIKFNWKFFVKGHWGLFTLDGLENILKKYAKGKFCHAEIPLYIVATDVVREQAVVFSTEHTPSFEMAKASRMSCSIPGLFDTYPIDDCEAIYTDGGVVNNLPVDLKVVKEAEKAYAIRLLTEPEDDKKIPNNLSEFMIKVLGSMMREIERKHIEDASYNSKVVNIYVPINAMNFLAITPEKIEWMYKLGYDQMKKKIEQGKVKV